MLLRNALKLSFSNVKPLKVVGNLQGKGVHFKSQTGNPDFQIDSPLETFIGALAACEYSSLKVASRGSTLKIHDIKFTRVESGLDIEKFMKGGPQSSIESVYLDVQVTSNVTQAQLDVYVAKALNMCPVYQILKRADVKVVSKWTNVKTLP